MVSPDILGVSSGAGFGAAIAILFSLPLLVIEGSAFLFGLLSVGFAVTLAKIYKGESILVLVLSGIIMSSLFTSLISLVKFVADPTSKLPAITYWLMGSLQCGDNAGHTPWRSVYSPRSCILHAHRMATERFFTW